MDAPKTAQSQLVDNEDSTVDCNQLLEQELGIHGQYRILGRIGSGGMGEVYRACQLNMEREVAIKILSTDIKNSVEATERFLREAQVLSSLNHPNIVKFYMFGLYNGRPYQIVDFLQGVSLDQRLKDGPLNLEEFHSIFTQIAEALRYSSSQGIVHRDVKPGNIFLRFSPRTDPSGAKTSAECELECQAILLDFGLVRQLHSDQITLTTTHALVGSPLYMSPEQCSGGEVDHRSDIYSLGCAMYESLTGTPAFGGKSAIDVMYKHLNSPRPKLPAFIENVECESELANLVLQCIARDPQDRPQTFQEIFDRLNDGFASSPTTMSFRMPGKARKEIKWLFYIAPAAVALTLLMVFTHPKQQQFIEDREAKLRALIAAERGEVLDLVAQPQTASTGPGSVEQALLEAQRKRGSYFEHLKELAQLYFKQERWTECLDLCDKALAQIAMQPSKNVDFLLLKSKVLVKLSRSCKDEGCKTRFLERALVCIQAAEKTATDDGARNCKEEYCLLLADMGRLTECRSQLDTLVDCYRRQSRYHVECLPPTIRAFADHLNERWKSQNLSLKDQMLVCEQFLQLCALLEELDYFIRSEPSVAYCHDWLQKSNGSINETYKNQLHHFDELAAASPVKRVSRLMDSQKSVQMEH